MRSATSTRVVLYGRTSRDSSDGKSVDDQLAELRRWAVGTGRTVVAELRDDGISASRFASKSKTRPGWQTAMDLITGGQVDELAAWEISRNTRDRMVWAALIGAAIEHDVHLAVNGKVHDPADPDDGFMLDLGAALAVRESAATRKRVQRAVDSRAAAGRPHGSVPYGYRRVIDADTGRTIGRDRHPEQAPIVQEIAHRMLARESSDAIAADLNRRGIPTSTGKVWRPGNLSTLALRPTYAGLRVHRGQVLDDVRGTWPALLSEDEHYRLVAMHADPARDKFRNPTSAKHLGTGIYRCGRKGCDGRMRVVVQGTGRPNRYDCRTCHRVSRLQDPVDEWVTEVLCAWLARPDVLTELEHGDDPAVLESAAEVARLKVKLRQARQAWADDRLSLESFADMEARTLPKIRAAEQRARPRHLPPALFAVAGPDAERRWPEQPIGDRRAVLAAVAEVTILPMGRGGQAFDPASVRVTRRVEGL